MLLQPCIWGPNQGAAYAYRSARRTFVVVSWLPTRTCTYIFGFLTARSPRLIQIVNRPYTTGIFAMNDQSRCPICDTMAHEIESADHCNQVLWECARCGKYWLLASSRSPIRNCDLEGRAKISGFVYDQNRNGSKPKLTCDLLEQVMSRPFPSVGERAERLLTEVVRCQNKLGDHFDINMPWWIAATYSLDEYELAFLIRMLSERGFVNQVSETGECEILPNGQIEADKLRRKITQSNQGFVAMSFDPTLLPTYEQGLRPGVIRAGYDPVRVDRVEHVNRIDDEIIARIRTSLFIVADFTGHREGVYFEAGFALGLGLSVMWTCKKVDMKNLHFDIRQYNTIDWDDYEDLASRLQHRIEATVGKGSKASSNP